MGYTEVDALGQRNLYGRDQSIFDVFRRTRFGGLAAAQPPAAPLAAAHRRSGRATHPRGAPAASRAGPEENAGGVGAQIRHRATAVVQHHY